MGSHSRSGAVLLHLEVLAGRLQKDLWEQGWGWGGGKLPDMLPPWEKEEQRRGRGGIGESGLGVLFLALC